MPPLIEGVRVHMSLEGEVSYEKLSEDIGKLPLAVDLGGL
jgi:hypothetical protein